MKKLITAIILASFIAALIPVSPGLADEATETSTAAPVATTSSEAARAASTAAIAGIKAKVIEGAIFAGALAVMATAISSGSDNPRDQAHGHGH